MTPLDTLEDLTFDPENANEGTLRGEQLLERSIESCGAGRAIVVDKHGVVIGGNKTLQAAIEAGLSLRLVKSDGTKLVVVVRTDLDLATDPAARLLAYYDNRVSEVGLCWNPEQLDADLAAGIGLGTMFTEEERRDLLHALVQTETPTTALTTRVTFDSVAQREHWTRAVQVITQSPGETFPDKLSAWLAVQLTALSAASDHGK